MDVQKDQQRPFVARKRICMNRLPEIDSPIFAFSHANIITFGCNSPALVKASRRRSILSEILEEFSSAALISPHATDKRSAKGGRDQMGSVGRSGRFTAIAFPFHANRPTTFWPAPISHILHQFYFPTVPAAFRDRGAVLPRRRHLVRLPCR